MNENYSKYQLIAEYTTKDFEKALNNAVKEGWFRAEPMHLSTDQNQPIYCQLMGMPYDHQPKADESSNTKKEFIDHDHD